MLKNARACNNSKSFQKSLQNSEKNAKLYNSCKKKYIKICKCIHKICINMQQFVGVCKTMDICKSL